MIHITIDQPINVPHCESKLITVHVNGDEAHIRTWPDGGWQLMRAEGDADKITDWTFAAEVWRGS